MLAGLWRQHEATDGTYTIKDLIDVNRVLDVQAENRRRADKARRDHHE